MDTTTPDNGAGFKTGMDILDGLVSLKPGSQTAIGILSPSGAGATSLLAQIARAAGMVGKTLVFSPMPMPAEVIERFAGMGVTIYNDVDDAETLKEIVREAKPAAVIIDGLYGYLPPKNWQGTRGDYVILLDRDMVKLAFQQNFILFMSKQTNRDPLPQGVGELVAVEDSCTDVMVLTFDDDSKQHRLRMVKSRDGGLPSQSMVFDRVMQTFSAAV